MASNNSCCDVEEKVEEKNDEHSCHGSNKKKSFDFILWPSLIIIVLSYFLALTQASFLPQSTLHYSDAVFDLMNKMWWGLVLAIAFVGVLNRIPREVVMGVLGTKKGLNGILRATAGGLLLDLCSHGVLVVGMKLYERGASLGQTIAFLVASPWNSLSMTLILIALIGLPKTLVFIVLSCVIAIISGLIFEKLVDNGKLPKNPNTIDLPPNMKVTTELKKIFKNADWSPKSIASLLYDGLKGSKMILRWIFLGVALAALLRTIMTPENFQTYFGPSITGLGLTIIAATIIEVCSEGSAPIAADLVTIAKAPGNGFTFLMTGVSTDYTEIMALKETTKSWKISLFLPLVTVPQVVLLGYILNVFAR